MLSFDRSDSHLFFFSWKSVHPACTGIFSSKFRTVSTNKFNFHSRQSINTFKSHLFFLANGLPHPQNGFRSSFGQYDGMSSQAPPSSASLNSLTKPACRMSPAGHKTKPHSSQSTDGKRSCNRTGERNDRDDHNRRKTNCSAIPGNTCCLFSLWRGVNLLQRGDSDGRP